MPYDKGYLPVGSLHTLYYEQCGNPQGKPVVFLHGGPGGGSTARARCFFDPRAYRIVLFDQRGCGQSTPHAELRENTTQHLVDDIEALRIHLSVLRWQVFGGSWGSTLALAYAQTYPQRVTELVLRGIFLLRQWELQWFYQQGTSRMFPEAWAQFVAPIPHDKRHNFIEAYYDILTGDDRAAMIRAAQAWSVWESATSYMLPNTDAITQFSDPLFAAAFARIECHYFRHQGFFARDGQLLEQASALHGIPGVIVQGRYDVVCPLQSAWDLHQAWPQATLHVVADAGHASWEPGITHALVEATDRFRASPGLSA